MKHHKHSQQWATKAIILARVSTEEQAKDGHFSIPAQLRILRDYVRSGGYFKALQETLREFQFDESASKDKRRKFEEAIALVERSQQPLAVIAERVDRFQRSFRESVRFEELRKEGRVELHFVSQGLFLHRNSKASDLQIWDMHVLMARAFVLAISDNVKRSIREKLERGLFPGYVPVGYKNTTKKIDQDVFRKEIEPDLPQLNLVKKAFQLLLTGRYTIEQLAEVMRKQGLQAKTRRLRVDGKLIGQEAQLISASSLYTILTNPFYAGKFYFRNPDTGERQLYPEGEGLAKNYAAIINWSAFQKAQDVLSSRGNRKEGMRYHDFKFARMLKCGFCGCTLTAEEMSRTYKDKSNPNADTVYYHCTSAKRINDLDFYKKKFGTRHTGVTNYRGQTVIACPQRWWKEQEVEQEILTYLSMVKFNEDLYSLFRERMGEDYESRVAMVEDSLNGLRSEQAKLNDLFNALVKKIALEADPQLEEAFRAQLKEVRAELSRLKDEIAEWEAARETDYEAAVQTLEVCRNLAERYKMLDVAGQRELLKMLFEGIYLRKGGLWIAGKVRSVSEVNLQWAEEFEEFFEAGLLERVKEWEEKQPAPGIVDLTLKKRTEASPIS